MRMAHQADEATPEDSASDNPQADHAAEDDKNRTNKRQDDSAPIHTDISCDNCNFDKPRNDIVGYRWKCTVCTV